MSYLINQTSVDDMRISLQFINPKSRSEIVEDLDYLNRSLNNEFENRNRPTAIKLLQAKIKKINKHI